MITVKELKEELNKFSDDCVCFAYEGEVIGIGIEEVNARLRKQGFIYCSEYDDSEKETELLS